jgi:hypothetical protein
MVAVIPNRPTYLLRLQPLKGVDGVHALRRLLKRALRDFGMKCLSAHEEQTIPAQPDAPPDALRPNRRNDYYE